MTIIKIAGLFLLTMLFLGLGYWIGYTERKYEDEHNIWEGDDHYD